MFVGAAVPLVVFEIALRFFPVTESLEATPVDAAHPVVRYRPNQSNVNSIGVRFEHPTRHRINNAGWVSEQDYDSTATSPLLAVIGDSYVEALIVPPDSSLSAHLASGAGPTRRVYAFAMSGWPLSQYLGVADYVRKTYRPTSMVIVVIGNDFDESLPQYRVSRRGLYYLVEQPDGSLKLTLTNDWPKPWYWFIRHSAVFRYLRYHAHVQIDPRAWISRVRPDARSAAQDTQYVGNVARTVAPERLVLSRRVIDAFLLELPTRSGLAPDRIAIVVDGIRPELYDQEALSRAATSYFGQMRDYLIARARDRGFDVVDLQPIFTSDYREHGRRFEFTNDSHWNETGHAVVARAVMQTRSFKAFAAPAP